MKNKFQLLLFVLCTIFPGAVTFANDESVPRIFILHSYEANHVCGQPQHDGIIAALKKAGFVTDFGTGKRFELQVYHMDTKRKNNTPALIDEQAHIALGKIETFKPDILVTLDDNAFRTVGLKLADSRLSVVFSGINGQPEAYNRQVPFLNSRKSPGHNITGVYEKLHIAEAVRIHSRIFPNLDELRILTDRSPTGQAILEQVKSELEDEPVPCRWQIKVVKDWETYMDEIHAANSDPKVDAIYPVALLLKDREGNTFTAPEIFKWTTQNSKKPEIAVNYAFTRMGLFGGATVDFYAMGYQAGRMIIRILKGESPGSIAIEDAEKYALTFNLKRASQLGIKIPDEIIQAADEVIK
ncbi:ABC transporter substrate binding protein [Desulfobacterales bacterium HSG2]|nr:ABC transporter substrate binding protein [Desulfobacterales bacterium HSG2]